MAPLILPVTFVGPFVIMLCAISQFCHVVLDHNFANTAQLLARWLAECSINCLCRRTLELHFFGLR